MADRSQINIRIDSDKKKEWEKHVDESDEYRSLTHFIEKAAAREQSGREAYSGSPTVDGEIDELKDEMGDIRNLIKGLQSDIDDLSQLSERAIEQSQDTRETDTERYQTVLSHVPTEKKTSSPTGGQVSRSTTDMIREKTGYTPSAVDYYLELGIEEEDISKDTVDGVTVYWKEGEQ
ncbi:hypothetical protein [Natrinema sp. 74]|uniref:hypothetical protein n=1 Tax=Natrinema sp. 74 TaxID=3384159 RepID=UPI0038D48C35